MRKIGLVLVITLVTSIGALAQKNAPSSTATQDSIMVTVVMRHLQENPVDSIQTKVMRQGFYEKIQKAHAKILSWNVVMGIGQIITLKFEPKDLREINLVFESGAWGGFKTEFYPTYDFMPVYSIMLDRERKLNSK